MDKFIISKKYKILLTGVIALAFIFVWVFLFSYENPFVKIGCLFIAALAYLFLYFGISIILFVQRTFNIMPVSVLNILEIFLLAVLTVIIMILLAVTLIYAHMLCFIYLSALTGGFSSVIFSRAKRLEELEIRRIKR